MSAVEWAIAGWGLFAALVALFVIVGADLRAREAQVKRLLSDNEGLREQLDAEQESAARWYREATQGRNVTPSWAGERPDLAAHIADALAVVEPRNVVRLPGQRGS